MDQVNVALVPTLISTRYSIAFLLEQAGRLEEAVGEWRSIIRFLKVNGWDIVIGGDKLALPQFRCSFKA